VRGLSVALSLAAMTACGFEPGLFGRVDATTEPDAPPDAPADTPEPPAFCAPSTTLVACYEFEGNANDASGNNLHPATTNVTFVTGKLGMAMQFGATSAADVAETALLDVNAITIEAWIQPTQLPTAGLRMGVVDNNGQWGVFLHEVGRLQCTMVGGISTQIPANIAANAWTHVACTYDGSTTTIYVNGVQASMAGGGGALATGGTSGISLAADNPPGAGSRLIGLIDQVRIFNVARSADDICASAGCTK
jgi:hypothetical protein